MKKLHSTPSFSPAISELALLQSTGDMWLWAALAYEVNILLFPVKCDASLLSSCTYPEILLGRALVW